MRAIGGQNVRVQRWIVLVENVDAAHRHHLFDCTQARIETDAQPDRVRDDFGRDAVGCVAG